MISRLAFSWSLALAVGGSLLLASPARAVPRTCGSDPVANTAAVLCAPPGGPCTATSVTMSAHVEVTSGGCAFDLGGRALTVQKTFQIAGPDRVTVMNAGDVTVTSTGKLKARGDFVQPNGFIVEGGAIELLSTGSITHHGVIDISGDPGGTVEIVATNDIVFQRGSLVLGDGMTSFVDEGLQFTDGGDLEMRSEAGGVTMNGDVSLVGANAGRGGLVDVQSALDISIGRHIDASGGASDGGDILLVSGDSIAVRAPLSAQSRNGGGFGGAILVAAGVDALGGAIAGGSIAIEGATLQASGSSADGFGGDGGDVHVEAGGSVRVAGAGAAIRANAGTQFDGYGGTVFIGSADVDDGTIEPLDGDLFLDAPIHASSGNTGGFGGFVFLEAGRDLVVGKSIHLTGKEGGGEVFGLSGGATSIDGLIAAHATSATGDAGFVELVAGSAEQASLTLSANVLAYGGSKSRQRSDVVLAGCSLVVEPNVKVDGHAGVEDGVGGGSTIQLLSRTLMLLGAGSQYLAYPAGTIETVHPPGQNPIVGSGVVFNPTRNDVPTTTAGFPGCGGG